MNEYNWKTKFLTLGAVVVEKEEGIVDVVNATDVIVVVDVDVDVDVDDDDGR